MCSKRPKFEHNVNWTDSRVWVSPRPPPPPILLIQTIPSNLFYLFMASTVLDLGQRSWWGVDILTLSIRLTHALADGVMIFSNLIRLTHSSADGVMIFLHFHSVNSCFSWYFLFVLKSFIGWAIWVNHRYILYSRIIPVNLQFPVSNIGHSRTLFCLL